MTIYNFSEKGDSWLLTDIGASNTSLTVVNGANFSNSNFVILIQDEYIIAASKSGNSLTGLTRAANGTSAVAHLPNERVVERFSPLHRNALPILTTATPAAISGSGLAGTGASAATDDHVHQGVLSISVPTMAALQGGIALVQGAGASISQSSGSITFGMSNIGLALATATPAIITGSGLAGTSASPAHSDHVHQGVATLSTAGNAPSFGGILFLPGTGVSVSQSSASITIGVTGWASTNGTTRVKNTTYLNGASTRTIAISFSTSAGGGTQEIRLAIVSDAASPPTTQLAAFKQKGASVVGSQLYAMIAPNASYRFNDTTISTASVDIVNWVEYDV